jgi:phage terminase large subunit-like protein
MKKKTKTSSATTSPAQQLTRAELYIAAVLNDELPVSSWVKKQVQRHADDLERDVKESGLVFDEKRALHALLWISRNATITEDGIGCKTGDKLILQPWQQAFIWILFGWRRVDGTRRFRNVYAELARGNGKSKLASAIALYVLKGEGVQGSAVFSIATTMEQAGVVFNDAALMAGNKAKKDLADLVHNRNLLFIPGTATLFRPLASNEHNLDGLKPNLIVVDELHAHRSKGPWNKCKTAQGKKPGSMILAITTAGFDRHSVCYEQRTYSEKVLDGIFEDDSYFAWICALDPEDDPFDSLNWYKSNPNLGISIELQTLVDAAKQAQVIPSEYNDFLRLRCNIWTESSVRWMPMDMWDLCNESYDMSLLKGRPCFGGMDLSTISDVSAFVQIFPPWGDDNKWRVLPHFFMPGDNIQERVKRDRVPYDAWKREGLFQVTPGNVIDFDFIRDYVGKLADEYDFVEIAFDPWNSHQIVQQLTSDGLTMVPVRQGYISLNSPTKLLMEKVLRQEISHSDNPVLRWMVSNTVVELDPTGSIKPSKNKSSEKIDGVVAMIMALARGAVTPIKKKTTWRPQVW